MNLQGYAVAPRWLLHAKDVPAHAKWVYVALSSYVDRYGEAHPSHQTLAEDVGISVSSVQRAMTWLLAAGLVSKHERKRIDGGRSSNRYVLHSSYTPPVTLTDPPRSQGPTNDLDSERPTSTDDEVVPADKGQQHRIEQLSTPRGKVWVPSAAAAAEVVEIARELDPAEHLVHYRVRCYELDKRPTDREWVRWFIRDQQKLRAEIEQASNTGQQEVDDSGVPLSWRTHR